MSVRSPYPDNNIPETDLWSLLFADRKRAFSDDKVISQNAFSNHSITYADARTTSAQFGQSLRKAFGFSKGDVLALFSPNDADYSIVACGALWAGGIVTPISGGFGVQEVKYQLTQTKAKVLVTHERNLKVAREAATQSGILEDRILLLGEIGSTSLVNKHFRRLLNGSVETSGTPSPPVPINAHKDVAFLPYSSGTTGLPKGVILTHRNLIAALLAVTVGENKTPPGKPRLAPHEDNIIAFLPFAHIYSLMLLVLLPLYQGFTTIVLSAYSLNAFLSTISKYRITYAFVVPPILLQLSQSPEVLSYDLSSLRGFAVGAAPISTSIIDAVYKRLGIPTKQVYGLTETSPGISVQKWDSWNTAKGSIGVLLPNVEAKLVPTETRENNKSTEGELWVSGPNIFAGYLNDPAATAHALPGDGWFRTGDLARYTPEDGAFYITGRSKELIKYKGYQVSPPELESLLAQHPLIADVAVIGVWSEEQQTELPRAYCVMSQVGRDRLADWSTVTASKMIFGRATKGMAREIERWLAERVAPPKKLRGGVVWIDAVPRNPSGKILRKELGKGAAKLDLQAVMPNL
ncbi:MAG: hypothetical protein M1820_002767 [Bogoriella megaspora]|nr:MAG: hypothetical protein M1820_002767 [Bogoriella megaspora]